MNFLQGKTDELKVLDAGGRDGVIIDNIPAESKVNVDLNKQALTTSTTETRILADVNHLPFADKSFDLAIFSEVLEHIHTPLQVIGELARTCRQVMMTTPNNSLIRRALWKLRRKPYHSSPEHFKEYSPTEVKRMFQKNGFSISKFQGIGFLFEKPIVLKPFLRQLEVIAHLSSKMLMLYEKNKEEQ